MLERLSDELPAIPGESSRAVTAEPRTDAPPALAAASLEQAEAELASAVESDLAEEVEEPGPEDYHFSAEDIEKVFIDARDWQRQYGARPGAHSGATPEPEPTDSDASQLVVDEPEGIEDITLEGLKVEIESETGESTHLEAEFDYMTTKRTTSHHKRKRTRRQASIVPCSKAGNCPRGWRRQRPLRRLLPRQWRRSGPGCAPHRRTDGARPVAHA